MSTYSFEADSATLKKLYEGLCDREYFSNSIIERQYRTEGCVITVYKSHKIVLQGNDADSYYAMLNAEKRSFFITQCGSDEVGTGDFFGPICVCACYVDDEINEMLRNMRFDDSKKLTDEYILSVIPKVTDMIPHSLLILDNAKYNRVIATDNMNAIKAKMHNKAYLNLKAKLNGPLPKLIVVDDFCGAQKYYNYIASEPNIIRSITFQTRAESQYISVAIASMISRYAFLKTMEELSKRYEMTFVKGAGQPADEFAKAFVERYGKKELVNVAKLNFRNFEKIR